MAGDLNFRLNETSLERIFQDIAQGAKNHDYSELVAKDHCTMYSKEVDIFGLPRSTYFFPSHFQIRKEGKGKMSGYSNLEDVRRVYKTKGADQTIRIPSYVDRIMWHSLPGCKDLFQVAGYFRLKVLIVGIIRCVKMSCNRITVQSCVNSY